MRRWIGLLVFFVACETPAPEPEPTPLIPGCGNGVVEGLEECDAGSANAEEPDACRPECVLPTCGDGIVDDGEGCDDGGLFGGDGCSPACVVEDGRLEAEPNDTRGQAEEMASGDSLWASLPESDTDCFRVQAPEGGWIRATATGEDVCPGSVVLRLFDPNGLLLANGTPDADGCTAVDPVVEAGARFVAEGPWTVCAEGLLEHEVPVYRLGVEVGEDSCTLGHAVPPQDDIDGDNLSNDCDADDDGDGVDDAVDNCPDDPNGPTTVPLSVDGEGFIRHWLTVGEITDTETTDACRPSLTESLGDDANAVAVLGDSVGELPWIVFASGGRRINFLHSYGGPTAREVYAMTWVRSDIERTVTLSAGIDDGAFAWLNGELLIDVSSCQGTNIDQFQAETTLLEGWNRLTIKVRDQGGGWAMIVRFLDDQEEAVTDLEVSMRADESWSNNQGDADGDGVGDVCDPTPLGPPAP